MPGNRSSVTAALATATMIAAGPATSRLVEGNPSSSVRVLIYEDLQCSDCAAFRKMMDDRLLPAFGSKVAFEHRDFPLAKHVWSRRAAVAARYFAEQKPELGVAFRRHALANLATITDTNFNDRLRAFASANKLDPVAAAASLDDKRLSDAVERDYQEGIARGVARTPTVLVEGEAFIEPSNADGVARAIEAALGTKR